MLVIKLSTQDFEDEEAVHTFFKEELRSQNAGKFRIPAGWIAGGGLDAKEPLLFSFQTVVLYSAKARSGLANVVIAAGVHALLAVPGHGMSGQGNDRLPIASAP
jgi:hypothetical protein